MSQYAPPTGPPPPKVPEGWKAVWNDQYKEWFYVNLYTKQSQWDKPTEPAPRPSGDAAGPPGYSTGPNEPVVSDAKKPLESNNPYNSGGASGETDEQMARRLQAEEQQRGSSNDYYNQSNPNAPGIQGGYPGAPQPTGTDRDGKSRGFLGKLLGKSGKSSGGYVQQQYPQQYPQQGYPQQPYGYGPQPGYGGYPPGGYGGGYGPPPRRQGGLGTGGAAALGVGGGLLGGVLLADAINDDGGGYGGDDGGGDYGGGDGGGDFGGGG